MVRGVFLLVVSACVSWSSHGYADPSKPIKDAMNHRASVFDLYMHAINADLKHEFKREAEATALNRFLAEIIERGGMIDESAKDGEEFSRGHIAEMKATPAFLFRSFNYDFSSNRFTLSLGLRVPEEFPIMNTDLSFESEQNRQQFMEKATERAWHRISYMLTSHRIQNGYDSQVFDEEAFKKEVLANTEVKVDWHIYSSPEIGRKGAVAKLLMDKGISGRSYTGKRSVSGKVSVEYDDYIRKQNDETKR